MSKKAALDQCEVILGNSNSRFSGVTSTMLQTLSVQRALVNIRVMGKHHLDDRALAISFWQIVFYLRQPLKNGRQRVFHARRNNEMIQALLLKKLFAVPLKIVFTSTAQRHHSRFTRWLMRHMDAVISTCDAAAAYLRQKPLAIIPHGVRTEIYHPLQESKAPSEELSRLGVSTPYCIGIFGRVRPQKGVQLFVSACLDVLPAQPQYSAIVVGGITEKNQGFVDQLKQRVAQAGLSDRILFTGELAFTAIPGLFRRMSLIAALSENEGFGLTVLEAMSSGVAVLATEAGAWPEIIQPEQSGCVVPVKNQQAVTEALHRLLKDPEKLKAMGALGRKLALEKYTVEREAQALCDFYRAM